MSSIPFHENVLPQLIAWREAGISCALLTLVGVEGSSPRRIGSQMAVNVAGDHAGYISSGCAEAAIIAEAVAALRAGAPRTVRYGAGSNYIDIVLPCGAGIDIHFDPAITTSALRDLQSHVGARQPVTLVIDLAAGHSAVVAQGSRPQDTGVFYRHYAPAPRVVIAGRGVIVDYVATFAHQLAWDVVVASPDEHVLARVAAMTGPGAGHQLRHARDFDPALIDRYSAVVVLFHDHDWEPPILARCEKSPAFYVGALGSRRTHAQRRMMLERMGCLKVYLDTIHSPVGLAINAKSPPEIALAIIAEILSCVPTVDT